MDQEVQVLKGSERKRLVEVAVAGLLLAATVGLLVTGKSIVYSKQQPRERNQRIVSEAAKRLDLEPELLLAVAAVESGFDADACSRKGAVGLLQVMPRTGSEIATRLGFRTWDLTDPKDNAIIGGAYLRELLRRYRLDLHLALAAYHAGPTEVAGWIRRGKGLPGPEVVEQFGFHATRQYVVDVLKEREQLLREDEKEAITLRASNQPVQTRHRRANVLPHGEGGKRCVFADGDDAATGLRYAHTVQKGETLSSIAARADVTVRQIVQLNDLAEAERIHPGDTLMLRPFTIRNGRSACNLLNDLTASDAEMLVCKAERSLEVYVRGVRLKKYRIALGKNDPTGDKHVEGDGRTPEGNFYVCQKLAAGRYGPSLGLSYPNAEDAERGLRNGLISREQHRAIVSSITKRQKPPWDTRLGGAVCIHGRGSAQDWTIGCIALDDEDASELFGLVPLGARVQIFPIRRRKTNKPSRPVNCTIRDETE